MRNDVGLRSMSMEFHSYVVGAGCTALESQPMLSLSADRVNDVPGSMKFAEHEGSAKTVSVLVIYT